MDDNLSSSLTCTCTCTLALLDVHVIKFINIQIYVHQKYKITFSIFLIICLLSYFSYRGLFGQILEEKGELPNSGGEGFEERKCQLLYSLNTSGHYHAYKEHMKRSVVQIVREKFLNEANTEDEAEMQVSRLNTRYYVLTITILCNFLSTFYCFVRM